MKRVLIFIGSGLVCVIAVAAALLLTPLGKQPLEALLPVGDVATIDFATLRLADKPNQFLMCPPDACRAEAQAESVVFDLSVTALQTRWRTMIAAEPRVAVLKDDDGQQITYVQRSAR